ncbi:2-dehydro-3-deoxygalactonokinase [Methylobacterium sp. NEAU 140]|uniref:2-dehydro-3-deoxygalactonokinase n=1 Tax=Methylobacterium sp. NEAU 140 TaxID=3064945 RepID=UPI002736DA5A|nr:2-dehydro-3-deoxygalactonokinase [Methylobacterium sp. NEAU 140]MDP4022838.1 2-dehydro-3-deoxygalactonokinase [Methylobacterium sp. NEAU 140]
MPETNPPSSVQPRSDPPFCGAVDWGTTRFRLWLLDRGGGVLAEARGPEGMTRAAETGFEAVLRGRLAEVGAPAGLPILICGMAGARQGWVEAPYVAVPAGLTGLADRAARVDTALGDVRILPGLCRADRAAPDVMRGEETQLLGLDPAAGAALLCMPGTHCKWVETEDGTVLRFRTAMTGELFDVLGRHSVLRHALAPDAAGPDADDPAFRAAAARALADPDPLGALFALRAARLLGFAEPATGAAELSGLLIGAEVAAARRRHPGHDRVTLVASGPIAGLYDAVLRAAGFTVIPVDAEAATRRGLFAAARHLWP